MNVRDQQFIETLFRACGIPTPRKALRIELTRYEGKGGYRIDVCEGVRLVVSLAWCPAVRERAYVLRGLNPQRADMTAVDALVVRFLEQHRYGLTWQDCHKITMLAIGALGEAIAHADWSYARRMWATLAPLHSMLIEDDPLYAFVDALLAQREALDAPCASPGIH
jgi:hypothetical protein